MFWKSPQTSKRYLFGVESFLKHREAKKNTALQVPQGQKIQICLILIFFLLFPIGSYLSYFSFFIRFGILLNNAVRRPLLELRPP